MDAVLFIAEFMIEIHVIEKISEFTFKILFKK